MVLVGLMELQLIGGDGRPLPEVLAPDGGASYVVAAPGQPFKVRFTVHGNLQPMPGCFHNVGIKVDGQSVGYSMSMQNRQIAEFRGFLKAADARSATYRSFVFSKPKESAGKQATGLNFVEGSVEATAYLAMNTGEAAEAYHHGPAATNETIAAMPEGKKFFMAPSLTTGAGDLTTGSGFSTSKIRLLGAPIATLRLRYETASTLLLRGVLRADNPAHRAILQQFPEMAHKEEAGGEEAGPSGAAAGGGRKRQQEQQQERQQGQQRRRRQQQGDDDVIDLTKGTNDRDQVLAARHENKVLECDLTADEARPEWHTVERGVHEVDL